MFRLEEGHYGLWYAQLKKPGLVDYKCSHHLMMGTSGQVGIIGVKIPLT